MSFQNIDNKMIKMILTNIGEGFATVFAIVLGWSELLTVFLVDIIGVMASLTPFIDFSSKVIGLIAGSGMAYHWWFKKNKNKKQS